MISALSAGWQELETIAEELYTERNLETAVGQQLDNAGQIPAQDRNGQNDSDYLDSIKFKILENQSYGGIETIIEAILFLTHSTQVINIEIYPASIQAYCDGLTEFSEVPLNFVKQLDDLCGGGIQFMFIAMGYGEFPFAMESPNQQGGTLATINGSSNLITDGAGKFTWALQQ